LWENRLKTGRSSVDDTLCRAPARWRGRSRSRHSIGFCSKLVAEAIEEIDPGQVEAITATGANSIKAAIYGIVPRINPAFIGVATYRWGDSPARHRS
jgi:hypothetical protein